jgi:hypothetical protein
VTIIICIVPSNVTKIPVFVKKPGSEQSGWASRRQSQFFHPLYSVFIFRLFRFLEIENDPERFYCPIVTANSFAFR